MEVSGRARVDPKRFFVFNSSSYQLECLVASLDGAKGAAAAATGSSELFARRAFDADDADTTAFFRRLLILWPSSSSEDVKLESESASGGGDSGFLRKFPFLTERFLKDTGGAASAILRLYTG